MIKLFHCQFILIIQNLVKSLQTVEKYVFYFMYQILFFLQDSFSFAFHMFFIILGTTFMTKIQYMLALFEKTYFSPLVNGINMHTLTINLLYFSRATYSQTSG